MANSAVFNMKQNITVIAGTLKKSTSSLFSVAFMFLVMVEPSFAGLAEADSALNTIKDWAYGILGIGIFLYLMYHVVMALMNKMSWADVLMAVVYSAVAGGVIVLGEWAWTIWGS